MLVVRHEREPLTRGGLGLHAVGVRLNQHSVGHRVSTTVKRRALIDGSLCGAQLDGVGRVDGDDAGQQLFDLVQNVA